MSAVLCVVAILLMAGLCAALLYWDARLYRAGEDDW